MAGQDEADADRGGTGRALAIVQPAPAEQVPIAGIGRPSAAFLAHLIATAQGEPQTRARRRATTGEAVAGYRAALDLFKTGRRAIAP